MYKMDKQSANETALAWVRRQLSASGITPLRHSHGTMTSLQNAPYHDLVLAWHDFRNPQDGGDYRHELTRIYSALGIVQGNGEWYIAA